MGGQPQSERLIPGLAGREVCTHSYGHHSGHRSSLAGHGEFKVPLAAVSPSQGLLAPAGSAYCFLGGVGWWREGKWRTLGHGRSCLFQVSFLCDLLLLYVDREAGFYWRTKYEEVSCPRAEVTLPEHGVLPHFGGC